MLTPMQEHSLTGGGDCFDHYHTADRQVTHDTLDALIALEKYLEVSTATTILPSIDYVLADTTAAGFTLILPNPVLRLAVTVIKVAAANTLTIDSPTGTINGAATYTMTAAYSHAKFKAINGNYYVVA